MNVFRKTVDAYIRLVCNMTQYTFHILKLFEVKLCIEKVQILYSYIIGETYVPKSKDINK